MGSDAELSGAFRFVPVTCCIREDIDEALKPV
jgi:hypothetical protein